MSSIEDRLAALEARVADLSRAVPHRVDDRPDERAPADTERAAHEDQVEPADVFWALNGLKQRAPGGGGAVLYVGTVRVAGSTYEWQYGRQTDDLLDEDWAELTGSIGALAHPVRLRLLREVLGGRRAVADLADLEGLGTSGQLYHHLRQLTAAGWLRAAGRGQYWVPPERVVPLLAILAAARR